MMKLVVVAAQEEEEEDRAVTTRIPASSATNFPFRKAAKILRFLHYTHGIVN